MENRISLNPKNIIRLLGNESSIFHKFLTNFIQAMNEESTYYQKWKEISKKIYGEHFLLESSDSKIFQIYNQDTNPNLSILLFCLLTYYAMIIKSITTEILRNRIFNGDIKEILGTEFFSWYLENPSDNLKENIEELSKILLNFDLSGLNYQIDLFQDLYQNIIHQKIRHQLGEFYTPDWLADFLIEEMDLKPDLNQKILDPSCGSGIFLVKMINFFKHIGEKKQLKNQAILACILKNIHGFDLNPIAIFTSKVNYLLNILDLIDPVFDNNISLPIFEKDALIEKDRNYDIIIGNPPWVNWEDLPINYRTDLIEKCKAYGLFSLKGFQARLGGGRKDFSIIFLYFCIDNYLKLGGKLGFLITQTIFKTKGAGEGFRGFTLENVNVPLKVIKVHDLVEIRPFDSSNMTSLIIMVKGKRTTYPIDYIKWKYLKNKDIIDSLEKFYSQTYKIPLLANPIDENNEKSPWVTLPKELFSLKSQLKPSDYTAYLGMNSGGANGVYWVKILSKKDNLVEIVNLPEEGKKKVKKIKAIIESDLLYPVIKSRHLKKWDVNQTNIFTIITQDINSRKGYENLEKQYPNTFNYLLNFKKLLISRAAFKKYFKNTDPFYSMFNISEKLFYPYKVVWNRMGKRLEAAVISSQTDKELGKKILIPDNVLSFIPFKELEEAHYVCAIMNSSLNSFLLNQFSVSGAKSYGTPSILNYLNIKKYNQSPIHEKLSKLSKILHLETKKDKNSIEKQIDDLIFELYQIPYDIKNLIFEYIDI